MFVFDDLFGGLLFLFVVFVVMCEGSWFFDFYEVWFDGWFWWDEGRSCISDGWYVCGGYWFFDDWVIFVIDVEICIGRKILDVGRIWVNWENG